MAGEATIFKGIDRMRLLVLETRDPSVESPGESSEVESRDGGLSCAVLCCLALSCTLLCFTMQCVAAV